MPRLLQVIGLAMVFMALGCGMPASPPPTSQAHGDETVPTAPRQVLADTKNSGNMSADDSIVTASPEEVCVIFRKLSFADPELFTQRMHPEALNLFRKLVIEVVESNAPEERAVVLGVLFDDITSESQLSQSSEAELFTSFHRKLISSLPEDFKRSMSNAELRPIGHVTEGKDVVHVIVRTTMKDTLYRKLDVVSLKRHGNEWFGLLGEELEFKIAQLARKNQGRQRAQ